MVSIKIYYNIVIYYIIFYIILYYILFYIILYYIIILYTISQYYGTTVVYAVCRWSQRRYATHTCNEEQQRNVAQKEFSVLIAPVLDETVIKRARVANYLQYKL